MDLTGWLSEWQDVEDVAREAARLVQARAKSVQFVADADEWNRLERAGTFAGAASRTWPDDVVEMRLPEQAADGCETYALQFHTGNITQVTVTHAGDKPGMERALELAHGHTLCLRGASHCRDQWKRAAHDYSCTVWWWSSDDAAATLEPLRSND